MLQAVRNRLNLKWVKNEKGITLIELLAVVVIIGIIAAIAIPLIFGTINKSKENADVSTKQLLDEIGLRYLIENNISGADQTLTVKTDLVDKGYLHSTPKAQSTKITGSTVDDFFQQITFTWNSAAGKFNATGAVTFDEAETP